MSYSRHQPVAVCDYCQNVLADWKVEIGSPSAKGAGMIFVPPECPACNRTIYRILADGSNRERYTAIVDKT